MKIYERFNLEDFVQDHSFRRWALGQYEKTDTFWEDWIKSNPEKRALIEEACSVVVGLEIKPENVDSEEISAAIAQIQTKLQRQSLFRRRWVVLAAAIISPVVLLSGWLVANAFFANKSLFEKEVNFGFSDSGVQWKANHGNVSSTILLTDGSSVTLAPKSRLGISADYGLTARSLLLEGEAVFDVVPMSNLPFTVESDGIITKVLGTVFQVRAWKDDTDVLVSVKSGKVTVQKQVTGSRETDLKQETILTPNQQAVVSKSNDKIIKTLVEHPGIIQKPDLHGHFSFNDTPISEVFQTLEQAYGIRIEYDKSKFSKCNLTAKLAEEDLYERLNMICETIEASYRLADGQILINGLGCD